MSAIERDKPLRAPEQRWQHGAERAETNGTQHVASTVAALRKSNKIGDAEVVAAARFYADFAFASGARDPEKGGSGGGADGYSAAQIDAIGRYRAASADVGPALISWLCKTVIGEQSLRHMGGQASSRRARVTGYVVDALKALSDHYAKADGSRPAKASPIRAISVDQGAT